jgi:hypothetical protein
MRHGSPASWSEVSCQIKYRELVMLFNLQIHQDQKAMEVDIMKQQ